jgi:hypothetical protein
MDKQNKVSFTINAIKPIEESENIVKFNKPLPITDNSVQFNGTKYDIETMDISTYKGLITADHQDSLRSIIGKAIGLKKERNKVTIDGIDFAVKENAEAIFAKEMLLGGYATDFSIETIGPWADDEGVYYNSQLVGLSMVVVGNNKKATINELVCNSIDKAKKEGLDTKSLEEIIKPLDKEKNIIHNKVSMEEEVKKDEEKTTEETPVVEEPKEEVKEEEKIDVAEVVKQAVSPLLKKIEELDQKVFDNSAKEPEFKKETKVKNELDGLDYKERHGKQINYAWDYLKGKNYDAGKKLEEINKVNMEALKKDGIVSNAVTLADFGNFVISPELLKDIEGHRSNYQSLLSKVDFRETLSLQMAWLKRSGDIDMEEVEKCDDGADGNLKPVSEYGAEIQTANLHELAAVTPVCNAATRFLAVDLLGDVAAGYRNDYDKKRAQLVIARLQQAVNSTGQSIEYNPSTDTDALKEWIETWIEAQEEIMGGVFIFNQRTYGELLKRAIGAGISGPLAGLFTTGDQPLIAGSPYIVVPNDLLPTLGTNGTKSFTVEGETVTINQAVFYTDLSTFSGRTSGGLKFDLSTEAAYEENSVVKSAFQRNELVLRGSFFRNGAVRDEDKVVGMSDFSIS